MASRLPMLKAMVERGSDDPFHWYAYAMELRKEGHLDEAQAAFAKVETRFPDYLPSYLMAGQLAAERNDSALALAFFKRGIEVAKSQGDEHTLSELQSALNAL